VINFKLLCSLNFMDDKRIATQRLEVFDTLFPARERPKGGGKECFLSLHPGRSSNLLAFHAARVLSPN
jgi:hypothetical protein